MHAVLMTVERLDHTDVGLFTILMNELLAFSTNCKLALTTTCFSARKDGISHTYNGTSSTDCTWDAPTTVRGTAIS